MKKRLFIYAIVTIFAGLAGFFGISVYMNRTNNFETAKESVTEIAKIYATLYSKDSDLETFVQSGTDTRITIISPDGTVLADSRPLDLEYADSPENHLNRPEVQAALNNTPQTHIRHSDTVNADLIYYALKVGTGDDYVFIRASIPVAKVNSRLFQTIPLLLIILILLAVACVILIRNLVNRITKPFNSIEDKLRLLSQGEYNLIPIEGSYEEIDRITHEIDEIALILQNSFGLLNEEKDKLDYILNNIGDGIFTADENGDITLINNTALDIFGANQEVVGKDLVYLTSDKSLAEAVRGCVVSHNNAIFEIVHGGKIFLVKVKRLAKTNLTMAVFSDVTENRENAKQREEFFANASHELKTPLTAIKGFTELTAINNKDAGINKYIGSITRETDRMLLLIGDMLKISELESSQNLFRAEITPILLSDILNEVRDTMSTVMNEKSVTFKVSGDIRGVAVNAEQGHIYDVVKNLVENATRYNNRGGEVNAVVKCKKNTVRLIISDNGIGIPPEEHARIFERFYRVEKSRSGLSGGTGLGLSIVKHICALYGWGLSLTSKAGVGTEVTVTFNDS